jgi:hypothetical protein
LVVGDFVGSAGALNPIVKVAVASVELDGSLAALAATTLVVAASVEEEGAAVGAAV